MDVYMDENEKLEPRACSSHIRLDFPSFGSRKTLIEIFMRDGSSTRVERGIAHLSRKDVFNFFFIESTSGYNLSSFFLLLVDHS